MEHDEVKRVSAELEELLGHFPGEKMEDVNQAWKEMAASLNRTGEPEHRESGDLDLANQNAANQNIENQNAANQNTANPELAESEPEHTDRDDGEKENLRNSRGKWSENIMSAECPERRGTKGADSVRIGEEPEHFP